jgi:hypothetical protein
MSIFSNLGSVAGAPKAPANTPSGMTGSANDMYAALTRQQWATYVSTFVPIENQLIKYATDTTLPGQEMQKASADVNAAYTQQAGATARRLRGLGVTLSPEEQAAQAKQYGLSKSLADVQAQNVAGDLTRQRQQSILGNPAPT